MKRFLLALFGTVGGLAALLSFKTHSPVASAGTLPQQGLAPTQTQTHSRTGSGNARTTPTHRRSVHRTTTPSATTRHITGQAVSTPYGVVQVKVTVRGSKIINVGFVQLTAFDERSQQINSYAAPQLLRETLAAQSANIDGVSGATYTSDGYRQSLQSALDKAGVR